MGTRETHICSGNGGRYPRAGRSGPRPMVAVRRLVGVSRPLIDVPCSRVGALAVLLRLMQRLMVMVHRAPLMLLLLLLLLHLFLLPLVLLLEQLPLLLLLLLPYYEPLLLLTLALLDVLGLALLPSLLVL